MPPGSHRNRQRVDGSRSRLDASSRTKTACRLLLVPVGLLALSVSFGCRAPAPPAGPTEILLNIPDPQAFLDSTLSILRRYDFPPEQVDRYQHRIISARTTSAQWFEFWRADAPGGYQTLDSSLHTTGRVVTVSFELAGESDSATEPAGEAPGVTPAAREMGAPGVYRVSVQVDKSRYSAPERQITTASGALNMYNQAIPTTEGRLGPPAKVVWLPQGRDALLEAYLLAKLVDATPDVEIVDAGFAPVSVE